MAQILLLRTAMDMLSGFTPGALCASLFWGALASGFFAYGMKQRSAIPVWGGVIMGGATYFIESALLMSLASMAVLGGMYWFKRQGY